MFRHLRSKIIFSFCLLMITGGTVTTAVVGSTMSRTLNASVERDGLVFARMLGVQLGEPVAYRDRLAVRRLLVQARATHPDVVYALVVSADGAVTDHSFPIDRFPVELLAVSRRLGPTTLRTEDGKVRDLPWPIAQGALGTVHVGVSTATVEAATGEAVRNVLLVTGIALVVGVAGILFLASLITRPLLDLMNAAKRLGSGDATAGARVVGRDEIAALATAFNQMATAVRERIALAERVHRAERLAVAGEIAAGVVHTVNNPLDGVRRALDLAAKNPDDKPRVARMLALASEGTERIVQVTHTLLGFARAEPSPAPARVAPSTIVEGAVDLVRLRAEARAVTMHVDVPADLPALWLDAQAIKEVLVNLLLNAVDACEGGGEVVVEARAAEGDAVEIVTRDNGVGIPPENLGRVFEPFFTTKEVGRGTGLGLSVARRTVELHGGDIRVASTVGAGTTFTVRLPVRAVLAPPEAGAP